LIKAELEFQIPARSDAVERLLSLPQGLRPTHQHLGEDDVGTAIGKKDALIRSLESNEAGLYLSSSNSIYDVRKSRNSTFICNGYFERPSPPAIKNFLLHMAGANPIFGFACTPEEKEAKNRVTTKQGVNTIESWVGRDTRKYIPGLYWLTLLSTALAEKHNVSLPAIEGVALEHIELEDGQHLFRFYEEPEKWRCATEVAKLCSSLPGVFNIEKARPQIESAKNFLDLNAMVKNWK